MTRHFLKYFLPILLALPTMAHANPEITVDLQAEKELRLVENGRVITRMVPADTANPGEIITYTLSYGNVGTEAATEVRVQSRIPQGTTYVANSATGDPATLLFSVDGGSTYDRPDRLQVVEVGADAAPSARPATVADYDAIRWIVPRLAPGETGRFRFQVKVNANP